MSSPTRSGESHGWRHVILSGRLAKAPTRGSSLPLRCRPGSQTRSSGDVPEYWRSAHPDPLEAQRHVMTGEDFCYCGGNKTGKPVAVDHEDDDWWVGAMRGIEPTMLVRLAWSSWSGHAAPAPELG